MYRIASQNDKGMVVRHSVTGEGERKKRDTERENERERERKRERKYIVMAVTCPQQKLSSLTKQPFLFFSFFFFIHYLFYVVVIIIFPQFIYLFIFLLLSF